MSALFGSLYASLIGWNVLESVLINAFVAVAYLSSTVPIKI